MDTHGKKIILASNSPRRRELLAGLGIEFTVDADTSLSRNILLTLRTLRSPS